MFESQNKGVLGTKVGTTQPRIREQGNTKNKETVREEGGEQREHRVCAQQRQGTKGRRSMRLPQNQAELETCVEFDHRMIGLL